MKLFYGPTSTLSYEMQTLPPPTKRHDIPDPLSQPSTVSSCHQCWQNLAALRPYCFYPVASVQGRHWQGTSWTAGSGGADAEWLGQKCRHTISYEQPVAHGRNIPIINYVIFLQLHISNNAVILEFGKNPNHPFTTLMVNGNTISKSFIFRVLRGIWPNFK